MHDIAQAAADAARVPSFEEVARRGRRRRTRRTVGVAGAVALAVVGVVGVVQVVGGDQGDPRPGPVERPTSSAPADPEQELARVVDRRDGTPYGFAALPGDANAMATTWWDEGRLVMAVTSDGFASRHLLELTPSSMIWAGPGGRFVVRDGSSGTDLFLVTPDGTKTAVRVGGAVGPVRTGEVPVDILEPDTAENRVVAVAADGTGHQVPMPAGLQGVRWLGGRLSGYGAGDDGIDYHWSDDRGATWRSHRFATPFLPASVSSAAGQDHAVVEGSDGATLFPLVAVHVASATDPTHWSRTAISREQNNWTVDGAWVEDGGGVRLVLTNQLDGATPRSTSGIYRLAGDRLQQVSALPQLDGDGGVSVLAMEYADRPVVWLAGEPGELLRTTDGGATWESFRAR